MTSMPLSGHVGRICLVPLTDGLTWLCEKTGLIAEVPTNIVGLSADQDPELHVYTSLVVAVLITVLRYTFQPLAAATYLACIDSSCEARKLKSKCTGCAAGKTCVFMRLQADKFSESLFKITYYTAGYVMAVYLSYNLGIWPDCINAWIGGNTQFRSRMEQAYYMLELGWYFSGIFCHISIETYRKDFWEMLIHHVLTVGLIFGSYETRAHRIGILVLMCHDHSDIFLEAAKLWRYLQLEMLSNLSFVMLIMSWIYTRLYLYPWYVLHSCLMGRWTSGFMMDYNGILIYWLFLLEVLHVNWFYLILRVAERAIFGKQIEDVREEDGDYDE